MNFIKQTFSILITILLVCCLSISDVYAATINAESASYSHVSAAIDSASHGDTVVIPAGNATWSSQLLITKFVTLQGSGTDSTVITGNTGSDWLIKFSLSSVASVNLPFGLNNFKIDFGHPLKVYNSSTSYTVDKFRVHDMVFVNCSAATFEIHGFINGVIDSNTFTGYPHFDNYGVHAPSWNYSATNNPWEPGSSHNVYYEDNTFTLTNTRPSAFGSGGHGGRWCFRYNDFSSNVTLSPWLDAHGNQTSGIRGTMGLEFYGNDLTSLPDGKGLTTVDQRGGQGFVFFNRAPGSFTADSSIREEVHDDNCNSGVDVGTQHVHDSYYWNTRNGKGTLYGAHLVQNDCDCSVSKNTNPCDDEEDGYSLNEDDEFFNQNDNFDGSSGIGYGTVEQMNNITPTTTGVGFWVGTSPTSISDDNVGCNPTTPISGTLYRWDGDSWEAYYTPYTYPHPLRGANRGVNEESLTPPGGLRVVE